jgi:WD40 repeat protein
MICRGDAWVRLGRSLALPSAFALPLLFAGNICAADSDAVSFHRQLRPILQQKCQGCHQPAKLKGELLLTSYEGFAKGGTSGPCWVVGKPEQSRVVKHLKGIEDHSLMPEGEAKLPDAQIALFETWIKQGAKDDTPEEFRRTLVTKGPPTYTKPAAVTAMAFSPDRTTLAVAGYREVLLHKPDGSGLLGRLVGLSERIETIAFSPAGDVLLVAGGSAGRFGELQFWDWKKQKLLRSVMPSFDTVYGASFSVDGKRVAFGCADNSARIIDATNGKQLLRMDHHLDWVFGTALTLNGKSIITASRDKTVKLCETDSGALIGALTTLDPTQPSSSYRCLLRRPKADQVLAGGEDGVPRLFNGAVAGGAGGSLARTYDKIGGRIEAVAFSMDGTQLAAGGAGGAVKVYGTDGGAGASITVPGSVFALAFAADGKRIAVAGLDGKVRLFSLPDGKLAKEFVPVPLKAE